MKPGKRPTKAQWEGLSKWLDDRFKETRRSRQMKIIPLVWQRSNLSEKLRELRDPEPPLFKLLDSLPSGGPKMPRIQWTEDTRMNSPLFILVMPKQHTRLFTAICPGLVACQATGRTMVGAAEACMHRSAKTIGCAPLFLTDNGDGTFNWEPA